MGAYVSFSKETVADFAAFSSAETGVTEMFVIFPLRIGGLAES